MKKVGVFLGVALFCFAGYLVYLFEFKTYDVADAEVDVVAEEEYIIVLSDGSKIILDEDGNLIRREKPLSETTGEPDERMPIFGTDKFDSDISNNGKISKEKAKVTPVANEKAASAEKRNTSDGKAMARQLKKQYEAAFEDLEEQSTDRLYKLVSLAKNEYLEKQAAGQSISYPYFYNKYTAAASKLEEQTDQFFYALINQMKQELKANNLPDSTADAYAKEYEKRKDNLRNKLLKEAADF
ncbi:hypothetical protein [Planomicrobium sp. CPCC 101079]|uniref:hypothetical protein n=1 Tax=Planomicrobium sp. CPCC 101079 TaxID=2599618 RepID=UPI0011B731FF|nr:hypothetical protein [Planomicrobium sp. CPCC 101079]TWT03732.1 hypothetical protein FQV28_12005 [Planomicrobium sp. CPCC 101079]